MRASSPIGCVMSSPRTTLQTQASRYAAAAATQQPHQHYHPPLSHAPPRLPSVQKPDFVFLMGFTLAGKTIHPAGDITYGHLLSWLPKVVNIVVLKLTGEEVVKCLERGCGSLPGECGSLHHTSAELTYTIDLAVEKKKGRVKDVRFKGEPIEMERTYTVACTEAMAAGKYGYDWMGVAPRVVEEEFATPLFDLLRDWLKKHKGEPPIKPDGEGTRIKIVNAP